MFCNVILFDLKIPVNLYYKGLRRDDMLKLIEKDPENAWILLKVTIKIKLCSTLFWYL